MLNSGGTLSPAWALSGTLSGVNLFLSPQEKLYNIADRPVPTSWGCAGGGGVVHENEACHCQG